MDYRLSPPVYAEVIKVITSKAELRKITDTYRSNLDRPKDFIPQGDGTVIDKRTGLQWMRCSFGQKWTGKKCIGQSKKYNWDEAQDNFPEFARYNDWRLPNRFELETLAFCSSGKHLDRMRKYDTLDFCGGKYKTPTIIQDIFPNTTPYWYWSSSPDKYYSHRMWGLNFNNGTTDFIEKDKKYFIRLVRTPK